MFSLRQALMWPARATSTHVDGLPLSVIAVCFAGTSLLPLALPPNEQSAQTVLDGSWDMARTPVGVRIRGGICRALALFRSEHLRLAWHRSACHLVHDLGYPTIRASAQPS